MEYSEYRAMDGVELAELVRTNRVAAAEVLKAAIHRAEEVNPIVNAIIGMAVDDAFRRVQRTPSGPLAGVPFLLKNLYQEWPPLPPSSGRERRPCSMSGETAEVVRRWLDAGLIPFGRTNAPEFGLKPITEPVAYGETRNPWNLQHTPGGSSGGAAVSVAAGIVPLAAASDGGGSIRIPAACCGVLGFKLSRGLTPAGPSRSETFHGAAVDGVISRTVRDTAVALDTLIGVDSGRSYPARLPSAPFADEVGREPPRLRIGATSDSSLSEPSPQARAALQDAANLLEELGHIVEPVDSPVDHARLAADFLEAWSVNVAVWMENEIRYGGFCRADFEPDTRLLSAVGRSVPGPGYVANLARWTGYARGLADFHQRFDLLLTPTLADPPVRIGELRTNAVTRTVADLAIRLGLAGVLRRSGVVARVAATSLRHVPYTQLANITGRPAVSVPLYWTELGLPLGVQFVAPLGGDGQLFRLAAQLERARPWSHREPPLTPGHAQAS